MRKTVIDGSNTSGFQRTVMIARDGYIETSGGKVGIQSVCLEEDSARIVHKSGEDKIVVYRLDRLGIPLLEIATEPDIKNPGQAKEAALKLGEILRSTSVKRGLGTIRQDVNLSIKNGERIELKGFQDIRNIERAIKIEVIRQKKLVQSKKSKVEVRKVLADGHSEFLRPMPGASRMYPETDLPLLRIPRKLIDNTKKKISVTGKDETSSLKEQGLNNELISLILKKNKLEEFKELSQVIKNPKLVGKTLLIYPKEISSRLKIPFSKVEKILNKDVLINVLENVAKGRILESDVKHNLEKIMHGTDHTALKTKKVSLKDLESKILNFIKIKPGLSENAYMGLIMKEFKGQISGKEVSEIIKKYLK